MFLGHWPEELLAAGLLRREMALLVALAAKSAEALRFDLQTPAFGLTLQRCFEYRPPPFKKKCSARELSVVSVRRIEV